MVYFPTFTIIYHKEKPNVYNKYTAKNVCVARDPAGTFNTHSYPKNP